jgi:ribosomal protein S27E
MTSLNAPCPCGSGKKFKHCHGKVRRTADNPSPQQLLEQARVLAADGHAQDALRLLSQLPPAPVRYDLEVKLLQQQGATGIAKQGRFLPAFVTKEFEAFLKCGRLEHGFLRVRCESCHDEKLVAFSCKRRGFCPSCGARRMADSAALLVDEILPHQPMRQLAPGMACSRTMQEQLSRVLSVPFPLRFLFASNPKAMTGALGIVYRAISTHLAHICKTRGTDWCSNPDPEIWWGA